MDAALTRRSVLGSAALLAAGGIARGQTTQPVDEPLPMNPLGKTGVRVTRLGFGASFPEYGPTLLRFGYQHGIRYFDNSDYYLGGKAEGLLGDWLAKKSVRRDDVFVVTKSHAFTPDKFYERALAALEQLKLDTIDLLFVHGIQDPAIPLDRSGGWRRVKDRLVSEKKIRFMGFSTHAPMPVRTACLENAVKGGWVDALMVASDPGLIKANNDFNRALDACSKAGVGLVCMKTTRGLGHAAGQPAAAQDVFKQLGLGPHQAMQYGMWSDGRFACVCSEMPNRKIIEENSANARTFAKPLDADQKKLLHEGIQKLSRATCPGCTGGCQEAAGTPTDFCSITRYLSYFEHDGNLDRARELYSQLAEEHREWSGADLAAASLACPAHLDFERLMPRARRLLS